MPYYLVEIGYHLLKVGKKQHKFPLYHLATIRKSRQRVDKILNTFLLLLYYYFATLLVIEW
jgi:hypothetical protein